MTWYEVKHLNGKVDYSYGDSEKQVLFDYISHGEWELRIREWRPKKLDYKSLRTFYTELHNALNSGLQLSEAISHLAMSSTNSIISDVCKALLGELNKGIDLNEALEKLTTSSAAPYCQLINSKGTREDCEKSLSVSIDQLKALLDWSQRLLKAIVYPFCVIQIALIILIVNHALQQQGKESFLFTLSKDIAIYLLCSLLQLASIRSLYLGQACYWLEKLSRSFRLTKLFTLLSTSRQTGLSLQQALLRMPDYFQYQPIKQEIYQAYYCLRLGQHYSSSFPSHWFPKASAIAMHSAEQGGNIERALLLAATEHQKQWHKHISFLEKLIPALCLFIAGSVVASALVSIYLPLLEVP
ncbi:MAG: type II secretion system F family protein [Oceanospirillaceae bacterium]|nr:type II secretion system F family protein [Oceanospirillaceae bacterium]